MSFAKPLATAVAALAVGAMPASAVAQERCITRAENRAVVSHLMPNLIDSVSVKCARSLGGGSFLAQNGDMLASDLEPLSRQSWPAAKTALERQSGNPLPDNEAILDFGRKAIADGVANGMNAESCNVVDQLMEQLAPLPPENMANVFALFLEAGLNSNEDSQLKVCEAPRR